MQMHVGLHTRPLKNDFGVDVTGVDVTTASPQVLASIVELLNLHGTVVIRDQHLTPRQHVAFTKLFGAPADNPRKEWTLPGEPDVFVISNKVVDGKRIGDPDAGVNWHFDMSYDQRPGFCTILYATEVPEEGSNTLFADLCAAWNALPDDRKQAFKDHVIHHSYITLQTSKGNVITDEQRRTLPDVFHPLVRLHPYDGRPALRPCHSGTKGIVGMDNPAGLNLLKDLVAYCTEDRFVYSHKWREGDLVLWDNNCTLHRGTPFDREKYVRLVYRTWVQSPPEHYVAA